MDFGGGKIWKMGSRFWNPQDTNVPSRFPGLKPWNVSMSLGFFGEPTSCRSCWSCCMISFCHMALSENKAPKLLPQNLESLGTLHASLFSLKHKRATSMPKVNECDTLWFVRVIQTKILSAITIPMDYHGFPWFAQTKNCNFGAMPYLLVYWRLTGKTFWLYVHSQTIPERIPPPSHAWKAPTAWALSLLPLVQIL